MCKFFTQTYKATTPPLCKQVRLNVSSNTKKTQHNANVLLCFYRLYYVLNTVFNVMKFEAGTQ